MAAYNFDLRDATTLNLGSTTAPHTLIAVLNLVCPDTRRWWETNWPVIDEMVELGRLQAHLKFWNKPKPALENGNLAQDAIDYTQPQAALGYVQAVFDHQDELRELPAEAVPGFLATNFNVHPQVAAKKVAAAVANDVLTNGVATVPTLIFDDRKYTGDSLPFVRPVLD